MSERLATAVEELRAEETRIQTDIDALRRQVKSGETQLKQIQRALSVLVEKPRGKSANQKSAATRQEVIAAMTEILSTTGSIEEAELKQLVADKIASLGKSRIGLALRFTEALNKGRFIRGEDGMISVNAKAVSV
jgi:predicted  nucleic acid-binding Zn-ribbon protein